MTALPGTVSQTRPRATLNSRGPALSGKLKASPAAKIHNACALLMLQTPVAPAQLKALDMGKY
jgi:hypothetical protein